MLETFRFPDEKVQKIFDKYLIAKFYIYHVLTDTDSTCLNLFSKVTYFFLRERILRYNL